MSLITICIPIYNSHDVCARAIESAINQTIDPSQYEILIIDDNSNELTKNIISKYKLVSNLKIITNSTNLGLVKNWNKCLNESTTPYIAFLHHDDELLPNFVFEVLNVIKEVNNNCSIVVFNSEKNEKIDPVSYFKFIYSQKSVPAPTGVVFKNLDFLKYDFNCNYCPETDLYLQICNKCDDSIILCEKKLFKRYAWVNSLTETTLINVRQFHDELYIANKYKNIKWVDEKLKKEVLVNSINRISNRLFYHNKINFHLLNAHLNQLFNYKFLNIKFINKVKHIFLIIKIVFMKAIFKFLKTLFKGAYIYLIRAQLINKIINNRKKEPFVTNKNLIQYFFRGEYYPTFKQKDFVNEIIIENNDNFKVVQYNNKKIYYPASWEETKIKKNIEGILNEQLPQSPHLYFKASQIKNKSVILDFGVAEGLQVFEWLKVAEKIYLFEPETEFYNCLNQTFKKEIEEQKVILIKKGISNKKETVNAYNDILELDTFDNIAKEYNITHADYVKADIEGFERELLKCEASFMSNCTYQICCYHYPDDYLVLPSMLISKNRNYKISFSEGIVVFNRSGLNEGDLKNIYHPVFRKSLITATIKS